MIKIVKEEKPQDMDLIMSVRRLNTLCNKGSTRNDNTVLERAQKPIDQIIKSAIEDFSQTEYTDNKEPTNEEYWFLDVFGD